MFTYYVTYVVQKNSKNRFGGSVFNVDNPLVTPDAISDLYKKVCNFEGEDFKEETITILNWIEMEG